MLTIPALISASTIGNCHPYPGAVAQDVLELIGNNLSNEDNVPCANGLATISLRNGAITTVCASGQDVASIDKDTMVRRALTAVGFCALNDHGSISGSYTGDDGVKTCYMYPGQESNCT